MDSHLRDQFDRAVSGDPGADPGEMAHTAIAQGGRIRRRRQQMAVAGVAAVLVVAFGAIAGLKLQDGTSESAPTTIAAAMMPMAAPACSVNAVESDATDVAIFLSAGVTDRERSAVRSALDGDARVGTVIFESHAQAYERFRALWADSPDFVASVDASQLPESFRLRLTDGTRYTALRADYAAMGGVDQIIGRTCPASAPVGGVL